MRGPDIGVVPRTRFTPGRVRQVALPPDARALSTLSHIDYEDAFIVETGPARDRTGEQWARATLEDAPILMRRALVWGWSALGFQLGSTRSDRFVLGWEVRRSGPDFALLGARSRVGLSAELLVKRRQRTVLFATLLQGSEARLSAALSGQDSPANPMKVGCGVSRGQPAVGAGVLARC